MYETRLITLCRLNTALMGRGLLFSTLPSMMAAFAVVFAGASAPRRGAVTSASWNEYRRRRCARLCGFSLNASLMRSPRTSPQSRECRLLWRVSLRKSTPVARDIRKKKAPIMLGKANGNFLKNALLPKTPGHWSAGFANRPPNAGPNTDPTLQTNGITENAFG